MFKNLFDFSFKRSKSQAFGFYLVYFIFIILVAAVAGTILGAANSAATFEQGLQLGTVIAAGMCTVLSAAVVMKKGILDALTVSLIILTTVVSVFGGSLLGMIVVAYLTTRPAAGGKSRSK